MRAVAESEKHKDRRGQAPPGGLWLLQLHLFSLSDVCLFFFTLLLLPHHPVTPDVFRRR